MSERRPTTLPQHSSSEVAPDDLSPRLHLLGPFQLTRGRQLRVGAAGERLLAFLALRPHPVGRPTMARTLWPERAPDRAAANLRSVIWRLPRGLVTVAGDRLALDPVVDCDIAEFGARAQRMVSGVPDETAGDLDRAAYVTEDLLPDWSDDWVVMERERLRQLRIHALDALSTQLTAAGRYYDAIAAGLASIEIEPLRESAHRAVIAAHLAEGNSVEAIRQYERFSRVLAHELKLRPSAEFREWVSGNTSHDIPR